MGDFDDLYNKLAEYLKELKQWFVCDVPSIATPDTYELDVRAYCILAHAAFEEYFEEVALKVMNKSIDNWLQPTPKLNDTLLTLIAYSGEKLNYKTTSSENIKSILTKAKAGLSNNIMVENHGISNKHLSKIFIPVALQISSDVNLLNSLDQLVKTRGSFVHKGKVKNVLSPEDAQKYVDDCLILCADIRNKAQAKFI